MSVETIEMETSEQNKVTVNAEANNQKLEKEITPKEKLVLELTDMGFSKELVLQVINLNVLQL